MTLLAAMAALVLLSTITLALLALATTEPQIANNLLRGEQAFYVAESGLEIALTLLNTGQPIDDMPRPIGAGTVTITVDTATPDHVRVLARGQVGLAVRRVANSFERDAEGRWHPLAQFTEHY